MNQTNTKAFKPVNGDYQNEPQLSQRGAWQWADRRGGNSRLTKKQNIRTDRGKKADRKPKNVKYMFKLQ